VVAECVDDPVAPIAEPVLVAADDPVAPIAERVLVAADFASKGAGAGHMIEGSADHQGGHRKERSFLASSCRRHRHGHLPCLRYRYVCQHLDPIYRGRRINGL
jgi:hypothetical protein